MLPIYNAKYSIYNWLVKSLGGRNHSLSLYIEALFPWTKPAFFGHVFFKCFETLGWFWTSFFHSLKKVLDHFNDGYFFAPTKILVEIVFPWFFVQFSNQDSFWKSKKTPSYDTLKQRPNILRWKRWFWTKQWLWARRQWSLMMFVTYHTHTSSSHKWPFKKKQKSLSTICWNMYTHRIHAQYIYLGQWLIFEVNVGKHSIVPWIRPGIWYRPSNKTQVGKLPHPNFNKVRYGETLHACQKLDSPTL